MRVGTILRQIDEAADLDPDLSRHIAQLLQQHDDDRAWAERIGPAYTRAQVAALLGVSQQAVAQRSLLALTQRDGRIVYPVMQFDGDRPLDGIQVVVRILSHAVASPWTIAAWLTEPDQHRRRPIERLHDRDADEVTSLARRAAAALLR